jgi:hypothetical protein
MEKAPCEFLVDDGDGGLFAVSAKLMSRPETSAVPAAARWAAQDCGLPDDGTVPRRGGLTATVEPSVEGWRLAIGEIAEYSFLG